MDKFERRFAPLGPWSKHPGIRHLFSYWALPGQPSGKTGLRIGIRSDYLNLYIKGQSVAKLEILRSGEPKITNHGKYASGLEKGEPRPQEIESEATFRGDEITVEAIDRWIATAETYAEAEKRFVDDLIAANPNVIDIEMGLPAEPGSRSAPRMDLVVAQRDAVAFWEAKCSNNSELRAKTEGYEEYPDGKYKSGIHVVYQLRKYQQWMSNEESRPIGVAQAYRTNASLLLTLADEFERPGDLARNAWRGLAETQMPRLILPPGVVIGNYRPAGHSETDWEKRKETDLFSHRATSFEPFRKRIEAHGATVVGFAANDDKRLPPLIEGEVTMAPGPTI